MKHNPRTTLQPTSLVAAPPLVPPATGKGSTAGHAHSTTQQGVMPPARVSGATQHAAHKAEGVESVQTHGMCPCVDVVLMGL